MRYLQRQRLVQFRRFDVFRDFTTRQLHTILPARAHAWISGRRDDDDDDHGHGGGGGRLTATPPISMIAFEISRACL